MANNNFWQRNPAEVIGVIPTAPRRESLTDTPFTDLSQLVGLKGRAVLDLTTADPFPRGLPYETVLAAREAQGDRSFATPKPDWMLADI